ncbi:MAG TPA: type II toxin-antitoxin system VapC family toxin [Hymenobacter sp.]|jgi:hypothetical protein|uniref:type II toxin-antitoxin system VapC family toxin n=1 Tax=Hymenobacter sp. TaxID=1898978 RepID=UPI002EDB1302
MTICDTNIIIELLKNQPGVVLELRNIGLPNLCISDITRAELIFGARNKTDLAFILKGTKPLTHLPVHPPISQLAVQLMEQFPLSHRLSLPDALIAATALHHGFALYTLNRKDFRYIAGLRLHEPA